MRGWLGGRALLVKQGLQKSVFTKVLLLFAQVLASPTIWAMIKPLDMSEWSNKPYPIPTKIVKINKKEAFGKIYAETHKDYSTKSTHRINISFYLSPEWSEDLAEVGNMVVEAQHLLSQCQIQLSIDSVFVVHSDENELFHWETFEFNSGRLTSWEKFFFSHVSPNNSAALFVNAIDWTYDLNGITAASYGQFVIDDHLLKGHEQDRQFYQDHMMGSLVVGPVPSKFTLAHEIGHALLNLKHEEDPNNIMFPQYKKRNPRFSHEQCEYAKNFAPKVKPIL